MKDQTPKGLLGIVQRIGNWLPSPFMLFVLLAVTVLIVSAICDHFGACVISDVVDQKTKEVTQKTIYVKSLLTREYMQEFMTNFVKTYITFPPLGLVMVTMIGIGYVQATGFFRVMMDRVCRNVPRCMVTFMIILMACIADVASNAGIVISTTLAAALFASSNKNPIIGAVVGYAVAHGAEPTNFLVTGFMVTISSITQAAADAAQVPAQVNPLSNYYYLTVSCILLSVILTIVAEKITPIFDKIYPWKWPTEEVTERTITEQVIFENRADSALCITAFTAGLLILFGAPALFLASDSLLVNAEGNLLPQSPFLKSIVPLIVGFFLIIGTVFGVCYKTIRSTTDIPKLMAEGIKDASLYFVICFPAAFFIKFFGDSNLTLVLSGLGATWLKTLNIPTFALLMLFILQVMFLNLFVTSGSAKWLVLAPIFVPMFAAVGISPELSQLCYVISDTITDPIAICNYYIPIVITIMEKYKADPDQQIGIGNVLSMTFPFSVAIGITMISLLGLWYCAGWSIGPGVPIR